MVYNKSKINIEYFEDNTIIINQDLSNEGHHLLSFLYFIFFLFLENENESIVDLFRIIYFLQPNS